MSSPRFEIRLPRDPAHLGAVRAFFRALVIECDDIHLTERESSEIQLVLQEACVNSIRHAGSAARGTPMLVTFVARPDSLTIEVRDRGDGFDPDGIPTPRAEDLQEGGYGVFIMKASMDRVEAGREGDVFVLSLTKFYGVAASNSR